MSPKFLRFSILVLPILMALLVDARVYDRPSEKGLIHLLKSRGILPIGRNPDGPVARALSGIIRESAMAVRSLPSRNELMARTFNDVATPRRITKDWLINEIFDGVVSYFKWNILGRISETLIEDLLVEVLDPKLRDLLPRDIATRILNVLFKKFQFFVMFFLNSMFANF